MSDQTVYVVTRSDNVLATFSSHPSAIAYVERDDVGGRGGSWEEDHHVYISKADRFLIWDQLVWEVP